MSELGASLRYFSGEDCDYREYRRWKQWCKNKMRVTEKLSPEARGSFVWTLLQGRALEVVEHLKESEYQVKGGEDVIFGLLDLRWPEKDRTDEIGEHISDVFNLKSKDGETIRQWCARARECFDRCARKTGVDFPAEARGWVLLNASGLSEENRAVVLARAQGNLKFDEMSQAMRSVFPDYVISKRRVTAAHVVEDPQEPEHPDEDFADVELFLAEHGHDGYPAPDEDEGFDEAEAAEVLAATWRERRAELNQVQKGRRFTSGKGDGNRSQASSSAGKEFRRSFRVQVEELKQRTRCRKCGKLGHWQRECRSQGTSSSSNPTSTTGSSHAAGAVEVLTPEEHFICTAAPCDSDSQHSEVMLVSSPGYAILDSGCGKTIIGRETLTSFREIWDKLNIPVKPEFKQRNVFRYGNGQQEVSDTMIDMPIFLAGKPGYVRAAIVQGSAPLLLSRPSMKKLKVQMNFAEDSIQLFDSQVPVPIEVNSAGQYAIKITEFPEGASKLFAPADDEPSAHVTPCLSVEYNRHVNKQKDFWEVRPQDRIVIRHHRKPRQKLFTPSNTQCPIPVDMLEACRSTVVQTGQTQVDHITDQWTDRSVAHAEASKQPWTGRTVFRMKPDSPIPAIALTQADTQKLNIMEFTARQHRQLMAQAQPPTTPERVCSESYDIVEVFSPPRFALEGCKLGYKVLSADLCTGWDFRIKGHRDRMKDIVNRDKPKFLVCCPPCTWAGGWWHLNKLNMSPAEVTERETWTRLFVSFCCELMQLQSAHGGRFMFEHPRDSIAWNMKSMQVLREQCHIVSTDMCCYGLRVPGGKLIRKATSLLVSHHDMLKLGRKCPGHRHPDHVNHQSVAGHWPTIGSISRHAGRYTPAFVKAVLRHVKELPTTDTLVVVDDQSAECLVAHALEDLKAPTGYR